MLPVFLVCFFSLAANASIQPVSQPGSSFAPAAGGDGSSGLPIVSADGRYVLFASTANNLVLTNNNNSVLPQRMNVFLRDRVSNTTTLVSVNLAGTGGGNGDSFPTAISTNDQFVLFESGASNLVANDTNGANDVFVRDLVNGVTTLVSVSTTGGSANLTGTSRSSVMTPDGRYVAFVSTATNLVAGDTNGIPDVFVRDLQAGTTTLVSVGAVASVFYDPQNHVPTSTAESPEITPDGRYVVFYSSATNLVPGIATSGEVYVRDLLAGSTTWVSTDARAIFQFVTGSTNAASCNFSISDNGRFVAYEVCTNTPTGTPAAGLILRYHLATGLTDIISANANTPVLSPEFIHNLAMTPDGRFVAYVDDIGNYTGTNTAIYLWDAQSGLSTLVSAVWNSPATPATGICDSPIVSSNGQWVSFISTATALTPTTPPGGFHAYLHNMQTGLTQLLDADTNGVGAGINPITVPALSADGSVAVFESANLLNGNRHLTGDVFAYNTASNATVLISAHHPALPSQTPDGISGFTSFSVSSNGQFVAFYSDADDLVPNDTNATRDVFVRALVPGTNTLVSVNTNGVSGDYLSTDPAISGNGRYVAFTSSADDLVPGDANDAQDVFVRDLQAGTTTLVSVSTNGVNPGNGDSFSPIISADGRYVLFHSLASNLAAGSFGSGIENLIFRDLQTATSYALTSAFSGTSVNTASMTPDGHWVAFIGVATGIPGTALYVWNSQLPALTFTNSVGISSSTFPLVSISHNGQKLAYLAGLTALNLSVVNLASNTVTTINPSGTFLTHAGLQFSSDGRFLTYAGQISPYTTQNTYRYDFQSGTNQLISQNFNATGAANGDSDSSAISPDGRWVAFRSVATNLIPGDTNNIAELFIYDTSNNATILVSVNAAGNAVADDRSLKPVFSADGQSLLFQSWASDVSSNDFNNGCDLFALDLTALPVTVSGGSTNSGSVYYAQLFPAGSLAPNPTISWPLASGKTYQVLYKNNLSDLPWQNLPGSISFIGDTGYITDPSPPTDKRFYRIVLNP
jgi:hypothetical protein